MLISLDPSGPVQGSPGIAFIGCDITGVNMLKFEWNDEISEGSREGGAGELFVDSNKKLICEVTNEGPKIQTSTFVVIK